LRFATAVGYNALAGGKFEEKVFMYRIWMYEISQNLPF
jgi:hypothetical protein